MRISAFPLESGNPQFEMVQLAQLSRLESSMFSVSGLGFGLAIGAGVAVEVPAKAAAVAMI